jgi:hypothetical protein
VIEARGHRHHHHDHHGAQRAAISNGVYEVRIVNGSLEALLVDVYEGRRELDDLSARFRFQGDAPQDVTFTIDTTGVAYELVFIPKGQRGATADVYIQKR